MRTLLVIGSGLTLVGVPAGLALTGGHVDGASTAALAVTLAGLVLLLGRWPVAVLVISLLSVAALRGADLIGVGAVWPATAAFVAVLAEGRYRIAVVAGALALWYGFVWDHYVQLQPFEVAVTHLGVETLWLTAALAVTYAYVSTRRWQDEVAGRLRQTLVRQEAEARQRQAEERVDIARDLHDVVAHTLAVVGVHLNVALDAFDDDPAEARAAVRLAQDVRGRAMADLRTLVTVLRREPGLDSIETLAGRVRDAGVDVHVTESGSRADVPVAVAAVVHRVVQESLTNTLRHAGAGRVEVALHYDAGTVSVEVTDDGRGSTAAEGHGTTFETDEYVFSALAAGAAGFLTKEVEPDQLRHAVRVVAAGEALLSPSVTRRVIANVTAPRPAGTRLAVLTPREREVVRLVAGGLSNDEIATALRISPLTAKTHVTRAITKLGVRDRVQLVILAYEDGLV